jgi:DNA-binding MarR family transcriptional regulator
MYMHRTPSRPVDPHCACTALRKAARAVSRLYDERLGHSGVTATQLAVLRSLARTGPTPLSRLAEAMVMDRTSLYRTLVPMLKTGWIAVAPAESGRAKIASLTPQGREAMDGAAPYWEAAQTRFIGAFGAEAFEDLYAMLQQVVATAAA